MPNIERYRLKSGQTLWRIDAWLKTPEGPKRFREAGVPTREQAEIRLAKARAKAYEGRAFEIAEKPTITVAGAWGLYRSVSERDNDSWKSDKSRAAHLERHLGKRLAADLTQSDVDAYRTLRLGEDTRRGQKPSPATLDREIELLKRLLGYAVKCGKLPMNPLAGVELLGVPNVRKVVLEEEALQKGLEKLAAKKRTAWAVPVLLCAYDTGMRIGEVLGLRRDRIDWKTGRVELHDAETKTEEPRIVYLSARVLAALKALPAHLRCPLVFCTRAGKPRSLPRRGFKSAFGAGVNVHDLRHSFATGATRAGIPESVTMKMGGWKTSAMFRRYNLVDESDVRNAAKALEAARGLPSPQPQPSQLPPPADKNPQCAREGTILQPLGSKPNVHTRSEGRKSRS